MNKKEIYEESGYINEAGIIEGDPAPFIFQIGGRGIGKTYGTLKHLIKRKECFLYLRRTQAEIDTVITPENSPFSQFIESTIKPAGKNIKNIYNKEGELIAQAAALSTFSNIRGVNFEHIRYIVFDEFIPEKTARPIKNEYEAFLNLYETINRNRELIGEPAVKAIMLANANNLVTPLFWGLGLTGKLEEMIRKGKDYYKDEARGISVYFFRGSEISDKKRNTALYKLTEGSNFSEMSINNVFDYYDGDIKSLNLNNYKPFIRIGDLIIFYNKGEKQLYVRIGKSGTPKYEYEDTEEGYKLARANHPYMGISYLRGWVIFENVTAREYFRLIFC